MSERNEPKTYIHDQALGEHMAHAEKPYQEQALEYRAQGDEPRSEKSLRAAGKASIEAGWTYLEELESRLPAIRESLETNSGRQEIVRAYEAFDDKANNRLVETQIGNLLRHDEFAYAYLYGNGIDGVKGNARSIKQARMFFALMNNQNNPLADVDLSKVMWPAVHSYDSIEGVRKAENSVRADIKLLTRGNNSTGAGLLLLEHLLKANNVRLHRTNLRYYRTNASGEKLYFEPDSSTRTGVLMAVRGEELPAKITTELEDGVFSEADNWEYLEPVTTKKERDQVLHVDHAERARLHVRSRGSSAA